MGRRQGAARRSSWSATAGQRLAGVDLEGGAGAEQGLDGLDIGDDLVSLGRALAEVVGVPTSDAGQQHIQRHTEQHHRAKLRIEPALVGDAAGDKEVLVRGSRLGEQRAHPDLVPQRLAPAVGLRRLDDPAVMIGVHHPMPASGELNQHGRLPDAGHPRHQHRRHPPPPPSRASAVSNVYVRSWHCAHEASWAQCEFRTYTFETDSGGLSTAMPGDWPSPGRC